jgi:hypothetical protein
VLYGSGRRSASAGRELSRARGICRIRTSAHLSAMRAWKCAGQGNWLFVGPQEEPRPRNIRSRHAFNQHTAWGRNRRPYVRKSVYRAAVVAAFLGSVAIASAELNLTPQQKQTIMQSVQREQGQPAPAGFQPRVGASIPQSMSIQQLPSSVTTEVPVTKGLEYAKLNNNEILLIDPKDRRVADIIMPSGTTGAAPPSTSPIPGAPR